MTRIFFPLLITIWAIGASNFLICSASAEHNSPNVGICYADMDCQTPVSNRAMLHRTCRSIIARHGSRQGSWASVIPAYNPNLCLFIDLSPPAPQPSGPLCFPAFTSCNEALPCCAGYSCVLDSALHTCFPN
jgi:hypothetical protein